jgi:uncharacterized protein
MNKERLFAYISVVLASDILRIVFQPIFQWSSLQFAGAHALLGLFMVMISAWRFRQLIKLNLILLVVNVAYLLTGILANTPQYAAWFDSKTFIGQFGGSIALKMVAAGLVVLMLIVLFVDQKSSFLKMGDLRVKADRIDWLGIPQGKISWGKLALISAGLISLGTFLGTVVTVTGFTFVRNLDAWISLVPFILLYALGNSLFEGIIYRNTIISSLFSVLDKKDIVMLGAIFFGVAHYFGAPGGPLGIVMSGVLGWYLCRSMVETQGLLSSWLIHFFQDVVIFSAVILLGGFGL